MSSELNHPTGGFLYGERLDSFPHSLLSTSKLKQIPQKEFHPELALRDQRRYVLNTVDFCKGHVIHG